MIKTIISDFSRVLLFPKDPEYKGSLNALYREKSALANFSFPDHFIFNDVLLKQFNSLKSDFSVNIFTTGTIQNVPIVKRHLEGIFQNIFSVTEIGHPKNTTEAYEYLLRKLDAIPSQTIYIDDQRLNLEMAHQTGMLTIQFTNNEEFTRKFARLLANN